MSGHSIYKPQSPFMRWLERRLPIASLVYSSFVTYPTPRNLNYWWTFGAILTFMLAAQIVTGIVLAMHYTPHVDFAFNSVESIMRDVNYGWLLRYLHSNGASLFFVAVYVHIARGMYYGSYKEPREVLWILGVILFLLMVVTGFMGYVLPWGQMSFWAATVITNLFSAIPLVGDPIVTWLWGGYAVGNPTLNRFYSLHYLLPFVIVGVVVLHIWALHMVGQNNPTGVEPKAEKDTVAFTPYATIKDVFLIGRVLSVLCLVRVLHPELSRPLRTTTSRPIRADPAAYRPGMVLPAVLRHPARHSEQAARRHRARRLDRHSRVPALARHLAGALGAYRPLYRQFLVGLLRGRHRPRLSRLAAAGGRLRDRGAYPHRVLFRLFPASSCRCSACSRRRSRCRTRSRNRYCAKAFPPARQRRRPRAPRPRGGPAMHARRAVIVSLAFAAFVAVPSGARPWRRRQEAPPRQRWSFAGPFGMYDPQQLQRGFKIYREVCSELPQPQARWRSATLPIPAARASPRRRPRRSQPSSRSRTARTTRARCSSGRAASAIIFRRRSPTIRRRAANGGALPPDMSVLAKARGFERGFPWFIFDAFTQYQEDGPDYIHALLDGYEDAPAGFTLPPGAQYNKYFPGHAIGMPKPLSDGQVEYTDGTPTTVDQYGRDIAAFLMWAAEPTLDARKRLGFQVFAFSDRVDGSPVLHQEAGLA